jgi:phosphoglycerol transferase MdoB-like AlkP superfamily enzyme
MLEKFKSIFTHIGAGLKQLWALLRRDPDRTAVWVLFLLAPVLSFFEVELLSESNPFLSLAPWQWVMNLVWYWFILFVGWLITGGLRGAAAFDLIVSFFLGLVNHYVLAFRGRALFPIDLLSIKTAVNVAGNYDYTPDRYMWIAMAGLVSFLIYLLTLPKMPARYGGHRWIKWLNLGVSVGWCVYLIVFFCTPMLPSLGIYAQQWKTQGNGFLLNFTVSARYMHVSAPDGYSDEAARDLIAQLEEEGISSDSADDGDGSVVNFIVIMDESLADLTQYDSLTLSGDPLSYYHSLTENTIKGSMISPVTGGGTASVEFEALTGNTMAFLPSGTVAYQLYLTDQTASLAQVADALEARTSAYHPYLSSGWNRTTAYRQLGFDSQYYQDQRIDGTDITTDYDDSEIVREFVSDSADFTRLYALTDAAKEAGENCFVFNVTIQNHSGYNKDWVNLSQGITLTGDYLLGGYNSSTNQYLALVQKTDEAIQELIEHYQQVEEPTVILFFGDHQPPLNNNLFADIYGKALDARTTEEVMEQHKTPFFIWANFDIEEAEDVTVGSNFLGTLASQLAGYPQTGYMKFLSKLHETFTAITPVGYVLTDGRVCASADELTQEEQTLLEQYEMLQYYNLFGDSTGDDFFYINN